MTVEKTNPSTSRRHWLLAAGGVAVTAGAGIGAWQYLRPRAELDAALDAFWAQQWPTATGEMVALHQYRGGQPLLVNFWATWCPPCVEELPLLDRFAQAQSQAGSQGVRVLGIAADRAASVTRWLQRQPLAYPVVIAETGGVAVTRTLGNSNGGLPFSLLFDGAGQLRQRRIGAFSEEILQRWAAAV
ncbi:MAG: TlpA family protein disulfide reductase [Comamonas sp.]|nr:TlpA family protein disulfide reductase [Comamonas sp.]